MDSRFREGEPPRPIDLGPRPLLNAAQRWIAGVGAVVLLGLAAYVPWKQITPLGRGWSETRLIGYGFIFSPPLRHDFAEDADATAEVDWPRVFGPGVAVVVAVAVGLALAHSRS